MVAAYFSPAQDRLPTHSSGFTDLAIFSLDRRIIFSFRRAPHKRCKTPISLRVLSLLSDTGDCQAAHGGDAGLHHDRVGFGGNRVQHFRLAAWPWGRRRVNFE